MRYQTRNQRLRDAAPVTFWLLVANLAIAALMALAGSPDAIYIHWGFVPGRFLTEFGAGELLTVVSSMFLHGGLLHVAGNLIFLWVFGRLAEQALGSRRFGALYIGAGVAAAAAQLLVDPASLVPMIGASGAISGVLGAAIVLRPRERVVIFTPLTLFIPFTMSILTFGVVWVGLQVLGMFSGDLFGMPIAYAAHIGGFVAGYWLARVWALQRPARQRPERDPRPTHARAQRTASGSRQRYLVVDSAGRTYVFEPKGR